METLRAALPLRVGDVTLVPVERTGIASNTAEASCWIAASKEVVAVVVCDAGGVRVLAADSSEIGLDELIRNTPNLTAVLTRLSGS